MKKLIALFSLVLIASITSFGQYTYPRGSGGSTDGTAKYYTPKVQNYLITPSGHTYTRISPNANEIHIRYSTDTLPIENTIAIRDTTVAGKTYTDNNSYLGDRLYVHFKSSASAAGSSRDTLNFEGIMLCDSVGLGSTSRLVIKADAQRTERVLVFEFNGTKWVQLPASFLAE